MDHSNFVVSPSDGGTSEGIHSPQPVPVVDDSDASWEALPGSSITGPQISPQFQVLSNFDLLELIFSFFHVPLEDAITNYRVSAPESQHLLWASLTCKDFFEPSMNILWRSMDSWTTLLKLIPSLSLVSEERYTRLYTTAEIVSEEQLHRLHFYARRIRHLHFMNFPEFVSTHIYLSISHFHHHKLFPALRTLNIPEFGTLYRDNLNALALTPSSTLSTVYLGGLVPSTEVFAASLLFSLALEAKNILTLRLSGQLSNISLDVLEDFQQLETLFLAIQQTALPSDFMDRCSRHPSLKSLSLNLDEHSTFTQLSSTPSYFNSLQTLEIYGPVVLMLPILQSVHVVQLETIRLVVTSLLPSTSPLQLCLEWCSKLDVASSLTSIQVDVVSTIRVSWNLKTILPLRWCKRLNRLEIPIDHLTHSRIYRLCGQGEWNSLEILQLRCDRVSTGGNGGLTLYDLQILAKYCPRLRRLAISLNSIVKDEEDVQKLEKCMVETTSWLDHQLVELELLPLTSSPLDLVNGTRDKTIKDAVVVSQFIDNLFPNLDSLDFPEPKNDWLEGVKAMLKVYKGLRRKCIPPIRQPVGMVLEATS